MLAYLLAADSRGKEEEEDSEIYMRNKIMQLLWCIIMVKQVRCCRMI